MMNSSQGASQAIFTGFAAINLIIMLGLLAAFVYGFILFVKFARLGIQAFKIYIEKNKIQ